MSELHSVGVAESSREQAEKIDPGFLREGLLEARRRTWDVLTQIRHRVQEGMTEREGWHLALEIFRENGVEKHWHKPYLRFGPGTALTFRDPLQSDYRLKKGDPFYIDLGPAWKDEASGIEYEGDVGDTFTLGENPDAEKCIEDARHIFNEAKEKWQAEKLSGLDLYAFMQERASALGYTLKDQVDGHRLSDYPHAKYTQQRLARFPHCPQASFWVLEVQIVDTQKNHGAFYEDLLY